jgi:hypothetical protein
MKGYIAIITTIILAILCLTIAVSLGLSASISRIENRDFIYKESSYALAQSCLDYARLKLVYNSTYAGDEIITIGNYQCSLLPLISSPPQKVIKTTSQINNITTNLKLVIDDYTLQTISLEEISKF